MSKLGYTFYPKDWINSESVFELTLEERGFYRELIDLSMLNDNKVKINIKVWCRKYNATENAIYDILEHLTKLNLIKIKENKLFIPSCESRLIFVRSGKKGGGKPKKPTPKPIENKIKIPTENEFLQYAKEKDIDFELKRKGLVLKYKSWVENEWKDGLDKKIVNWKSKLLNNLQYINKEYKQKQDRL